ncbi:uncharacterized protein C8Q71DRAFT_343793 [Rhodofomes roseus]|uniref:Uncharacterized protein n=1 Tax=Rhodofomes roseus TaxID=34475 RepID=A0ABQ8KT05_9APHY|nr:uncharacterized protein C8Q71DRAFT_343793 [Rhodofomes roseus]KAH9841684.1 hypothetical protein C8Q71DRAFT_343793 [Rhodofomes roseus]
MRLSQSHRIPSHHHCCDAMPKVKRSSVKPRLSLPHRLSDEEARAKYRRERLGLPGPVDRWIAASTVTSDDCSIDPGCPLAPDEVQCTLQMQRIEAPDDNPDFSDPDTFVLYLTVTGAAHQRASHSVDASHRIVLDRYEGWCDSLEAPDWTKWASGQPTVFRQRKSSLADVVRNALWEDAVAPLIDALDAAHLCH